ncbi:MAG TPA: hypothetical protein VF155_02150 [Candidatus Dormibacteraeota bacterium]
MTDATPVTEGSPDQTDRSMDALVRTLVAATPWLLDLGSWVFGALIGFALLILAALFTVGPVDRAVLIGTAALALGLPLEVGAFVLLRLIKDFESTQIEEVAEQAFREAGLDLPGSPPSPEARKAGPPRRTLYALAVAFAMLVLALACTITGTAATLWHMAWWIAAAFLATVGATGFFVFWPIAATGGQDRGRGRSTTMSPPPTPVGTRGDPTG